MSTVGQIQTHEAIMRSHDGLVDLEIGRRTAQALDIDTPLLRVEMESLEGSGLASEFDTVDVLVSTIVSSTRIPLGVLVGHGAAESIKDGAGSDILRGNEDDGLSLTLDFFFLKRRL